MGVRRSCAAAARRNPDGPTYYFSQASQTDPADARLLLQPWLRLLDRQGPPAAVYWLREAVRRDPADGDAHFVLGAALQQTGATAEAARERELAQRLSSSYESCAAGAAAIRCRAAWSA